MKMQASLPNGLLKTMKTKKQINGPLLGEKCCLHYYRVWIKESKYAIWQLFLSLAVRALGADRIKSLWEFPLTTFGESGWRQTKMALDNFWKCISFIRLSKVCRRTDGAVWALRFSFQSSASCGKRRISILFQVQPNGVLWKARNVHPAPGLSIKECKVSGIALKL